MSYIGESFLRLLGKEPARPTKEDIRPEAQEIHFYKKANKVITREHILKLHEVPQKKTWRNRRWLTLLAINLLFVVSYHLDIQLLEGALTASRFMGFHMADLNSSLQVMLAFKEVLINLVIGTSTVLVMWLLLGGRTFCSWVCPYHLLAEWAEKLHLKLVEKKIIKGRTFHRGTRTVLYVVFALLAFVTGYTVFETISPTGILSRALIYGPGVALVWVGLLLLFEIFVSRRAWCRYVCPIGITYGIVGLVSPLRVEYNVVNCAHEGDCRKACLVPHVLDMTIKGRARDVNVPVGADCTRCGICVDLCPTDSLKFVYKWPGK
ncbi:MAG TPA: NapH/MauN family ferredoxin-type protein [Gammaproteobacteria bacterium]|nr:NapH/MauN family ferredoxin-type protein [Gammaproteobacteria bacterium]